MPPVDRYLCPQTGSASEGSYDTVVVGAGKPGMAAPSCCPRCPEITLGALLVSPCSALPAVEKYIIWMSYSSSLRMRQVWPRSGRPT